MVALAEFIEQNRDAIVVVWAAKVRAKLLRAALSHEQLLDAMEFLLDEIIEALQRERSARPEQADRRVDRAHGGQRKTPPIDLGSVVREYNLLSESIFDLARELSLPLDHGEVLRFWKCLYTEIVGAVDEFARASERLRRRADLEHLTLLAHEIRGPLSSARSAWELLRQTTSLEGASAERLGRSLRRLAELLDRAIGQSRLHAADEGWSTLRREFVSVERLLQEAADEYAPQLAHKRIAVWIDAEQGTAVQADPRLLRSAIANLVCNAVTFTRRCGSITLRASVVKNRLQIEVEDSCEGLAHEADELSEAFLEAHPGRSGRALGLASVRHSVEAHGGKVTLKNQPGRGCTFRVELPLAVPDASCES